jgi:hypothetical protein
MSARDRNGPAMTLARGLGWFSLGLGVAELLAPRALSRATGLKRSGSLLAGYGVREIATGVGILMSDDPAPWIWGRIGGDVLDIGTLGAGLANPRTDKGRVLAGLFAVVGVTVLDVICVRGLQAGRDQPRLQRVTRDYSRRTGWPSGLAQIRGAARKDFTAPKDFRIPGPLRPYTAQASA